MTDPKVDIMRSIGRIADRKAPPSQPILCDECGRRWSTWEEFTVHALLHVRKAKQ